MTELEKAAMRMALEALQHYTYGGSEYRKPAERAITALTQALATTERKGEPVALSDEQENDLLHVIYLLEKISRGVTSTSSDRLFDSSVRPRKMTIKDAQAVAEPAANILRKVVEEARASYTSPQVPEDTARLDWIERQCLEDLVMCLVIDAPNDGKYSVCGDSGQPGYGKTLREAIDAARKGE